MSNRRWWAIGVVLALVVTVVVVADRSRSGSLGWLRPEPGPPVPLRTVVLHDVHGLWGGPAIWIREDNTAVVQVVVPPPAGRVGLLEKRYTVAITPEHRAEIERLVGAHHFFTLRVNERPGVPDELQYVIAVVTRTGARARVTKWAGDKHPDFDPLYQYLLGLCAGVEGRTPVHEGSTIGSGNPRALNDRGVRGGDVDRLNTSRQERE
jgi:hypothetical protein